MKMSPKILFALALIAASLSKAADAQTDDLDWVDWDLVNAGEVVFTTEKVDRGTVRIDLAIAMKTDHDTLWDLLTACEISPEYVPHVVACRRIAAIRECDCEFFEQTVKPAFFLPRFEHVFALEYFRPGRIEVSHVSGPIDRMEGGWQLIERAENDIVLIYSLTLKPGFPVPPLFVRNTLRSDLPKVLTALRERAERQANE